MLDFIPKAVLFDMDGVILDTEPVSKEGWRRAAEAQGYGLPDEVYNSLVGMNLRTASEKLKQIYDEAFNFEEACKTRDAYVREQRILHGVPVKKGIFNLLDKLDALGIPCCVATSTAKERAASRLGDAGLAGRFKAIIGGDSVTNGKPHPEIYLKAAEVMGQPPSECLAIEDSRNGVESAYRAGAKVILVPDLQPPDEATLKRACAACKDLDEVAGML